MPGLFDVYIAVDWSARNAPSPRKPTKDALWVSEALADEREHSSFSNESYWTTRFACRSYIRERLLYYTSLKRRVLLGFDFSFGYPTGFARALDLQGDIPAWRKVWNELTRLIRDEEHNQNNRFEVAAELNMRCGGPTPGPLWGCPADHECSTLKMKSPAQGYPYPVAPDLLLDRFRWADKGERGIQPGWKLLGNGSVGGQILVGIPAVCQLRDDPLLASFSKVWPFETGFTSRPIPESGPAILHVEIWPGLVPGPLDPTLVIRDQAQVRAVTNWLRARDSAGQLHPLFVRPPELSDEAVQVCLAEEGWILGGGLNRSHS